MGTSSYPDALVALGATVVFTADDGVARRHLWVSDGTRSGTALIKAIPKKGHLVLSSRAALASGSCSRSWAASPSPRAPNHGPPTAPKTDVLMDIAPGAAGSFPLGRAVADERDESRHRARLARGRARSDGAREKVLRVAAPRAALIARSGGGKTTTLLQHALALAMDDDRPLPVYVELRDLDGGYADLERLIVESIQQVVSTATSQDLVDGAWALLLDGANGRSEKGDPSRG